MHDSGVGATLKHFPGLGGAAGDPHQEVVSDPVAPAQWSATTSRSFAAGIAAGADAVMTTSVRAPNLDSSNRPAMLSPAIVHLLRDPLLFAGVIFTDSLSMTAVGESMPKATVDAAVAGNDLLLMSSGSTALEDQADQMLLNAVRSGRIPEDQVQASAQRVLPLHRRYTAAPTAATFALAPAVQVREGSLDVYAIDGELSVDSPRFVRTIVRTWAIPSQAIPSQTACNSEFDRRRCDASKSPHSSWGCRLVISSGPRPRSEQPR